jgi:adenylate cyclase
LHSLWLPIAPLLMGWIFAATLTASAIAHAESAQRSHLMRLFSAYLSAPIAREIWAKRGAITARGRPIPQRLNATVMFSDINDFTTVSEALDINRMLHWLETYMDAMTRVVDGHGGIVEHFAGDGLLAIWGVPIARRTQREITADAAAAVHCALRMSEEIERLNGYYRQEDLPEMRVGLGIYSGELIGCALGTAERQQYAAIGDTTNTAARLVTVAKDIMKAPGADMICEVVIGNTTQALVGEMFASRALGSFALKGKNQLVECFEIGGVPHP